MKTQLKPIKADKDILVKAPSEVELIKDKSHYLRGTIAESLADEATASVKEDDTQLIKFHGIYQQDDRENRKERAEKKLEPDYSFMIRVRMPGGLVSAKQWAVLDDLASTHSIPTLKLTTRQAVQFHGVIKSQLKKTIQGFNRTLLDSIAACGDVNRNVMCTPIPQQSAIHSEVYKIACEISLALLPSTKAYHEIWLDEKKITEPEEIEPIYGKHYLPRKFKIAIAVPPHNDVDIYANDIGLSAVERQGILLGFNVAVGGGMGQSFGRPDTYPRLATEIGFVAKEQIIEACKAIMLVQRDYGNRSDRKLSRLKYTIDRLGIAAFKTLVESHLKAPFKETQEVVYWSNNDTYGWTKGVDNKHFLTLYIEHGRVKDTNELPLKKALRAIADAAICDFRLTGNQNLVLGNIKEVDKNELINILDEYGITHAQKALSGLRKSSIACVAFNTCSLAMAEAERYLPSLITKLEDITKELGIYDRNINIRMTGCPNGCGRPYLGEIGFVGKALGKYNLYLGANANGSRLNKLYQENANEAELLATLRPLLQDYSSKSEKNEGFGDFLIRSNILEPTYFGLDFHEKAGPKNNSFQHANSKTVG